MALVCIDVRIDSGMYCMYWYVLVRTVGNGMYWCVQVLVGICTYSYVLHVYVFILFGVRTGM